jgi:hypothetical protein
MKWNYWLRWMPILIAPPIVLMGGLAVAQNDDACFMKTSSGQRIPLNKLCGKSGGEAVSDFMWDESNYDPNYVKINDDGSWSVKTGGKYPFKDRTGAILWPDGRVTEGDGLTYRSVWKGNEQVGVQYYKADRITPLQAGEKVTLPSGMVVTQENLQP